MSKLRELRFGKKEKPDAIDPRAYSQDGYLIHQGRLSGVRYGRKTSKEIGCGWIACYNFLKYMGCPEPPLKIAYRQEGMLLWGGYLGSHPLAIWGYLRRRGFRFDVAITRRGMERLVRQAVAEHPHQVAGVLAYIHKKGSHYTTFIDEGSYQRALGGEVPHTSLVRREPAVRFLNAVYGVENHCLTVKDFFQKYVSFPLCFVLVAKK